MPSFDINVMNAAASDVDDVTFGRSRGGLLLTRLFVAGTYNQVVAHKCADNHFFTPPNPSYPNLSNTTRQYKCNGSEWQLLLDDDSTVAMDKLDCLPGISTTSFPLQIIPFQCRAAPCTLSMLRRCIPMAMSLMSAMV